MSRYGRKLGSNEVREIRDLYAKGRHTCRSLGAKFGVCKSNIEWVLNGKTWKHIVISEELAERILEIKQRNNRAFMGSRYE